MKENKGAQGFENFYALQFGDRWPALKAALCSPKGYLAIVNPFSGFEFGPGSETIPGLTFAHQTGHSFAPPEITPAGFLNYYLLDAASVLAIEGLDPRPGEKVIDLCAAPGGKSLLCALRLKNEGLLVSNDRSATRRARIHKIFSEYLPETHQTNHKVTGHDATKWCLYEKDIYDKVLLDAPCSSERHVLMDPKELACWAPGRTKAVAVTQFAMLASALEIVKVGGTIVYSTCALSQLENDDIIKKLLQKRAGRFEVVRAKFPIGETTEHGWRVLPDASGWGPFYLSVLKKLK
ncbi:MAG TPA: RsmB/NOP family class I SAM-dependent RNA methyltransferase [Bacteriovoracaceae bacterium]|nr:RsmB/NOP family class I SAM-dependent RNA methyltransferase [Bacteriovoracaceae bacterium]